MVTILTKGGDVEIIGVYADKMVISFELKFWVEFKNSMAHSL